MNPILTKKDIGRHPMVQMVLGQVVGFMPDTNNQFELVYQDGRVVIFLADHEGWHIGEDKLPRA